MALVTGSGVAELLPGGAVAWELPRTYGNRRTLICNLGVGVGWRSGSQAFSVAGCGRETPIASFLLVLGTGAEQRLFLVQTGVVGKAPQSRRAAVRGTQAAVGAAPRPAARDGEECSEM